MSKYTLKRRGQQGGQRSRTRTTEHNDNIFFYNDTSSLECPITFGIFYDPVIAEDGHTYEKWAILKWFENNNRSPKTNKPIGNCLISNTALKILIEQGDSFVENFVNTINIVLNDQKRMYTLSKNIQDIFPIDAERIIIEKSIELMKVNDE